MQERTPDVASCHLVLGRASRAKTPHSEAHGSHRPAGARARPPDGRRAISCLACLLYTSPSPRD
eukprot:1491192-Alexandrium_andersonii.AAC.1